jgi:hypothetical protein
VSKATVSPKAHPNDGRGVPLTTTRSSDAELRGVEVTGQRRATRHQAKCDADVIAPPPAFYIDAVSCGRCGIEHERQRLAAGAYDDQRDRLRL